MGNREDRVDQGTLEGQDPTQEVGPEECEAKPADSELRAGAFEETADASHPKFSEEIQDAYQPEPDFMVPHPDDGLPSPANERDSDNLATVPAFTYENVLCVGDDREWVELFEHEIDFLKRIEGAEDLEAGVPAGVFGAMPPGSGDGGHEWYFRALVSPEGLQKRVPKSDFQVRSLYTPEGDRRSRLVFKAEHVTELYGRHVAKNHQAVIDPEARPGDEARSQLVFVRPVREPCKFYMRQVFSNDSIPDPNDPGHKLIFRNCTVRRSVGGAFLSLRDEAIFACDYRDPPHPESTKKLDDEDKKSLASDAHRTYLPLFKDMRGFARPDQPVQGPPVPAREDKKE